MEDLNLNKKYKNIAIIGHMGSGKTLIGKLIAKKLNIQHLDSDQLIEKITGKSISDIFKHKGENYFREIECNTILDLNHKNNFVLSLGGGSILNIKTRKLLNDKFITLFLDIDLDILAERLKKSSKRPLLNGINIRKKMNELDLIRRKYYLLADIKLKNYEEPKEIINNFFLKYTKLNEENNQY